MTSLSKCDIHSTADASISSQFHPALDIPKTWLAHKIRRLSTKLAGRILRHPTIACQCGGHRDYTAGLAWSHPPKTYKNTNHNSIENNRRSRKKVAINLWRPSYADTDDKFPAIIAGPLYWGSSRPHKHRTTATKTAASALSLAQS